MSFDFIQREGIIGAFIPVTFAVDRMEIEPACFSGGTPVVAFGAGDASHRRKSAAAMRVAVTVAMEATRRAAEPAIDRAAIGPAVRARHGLQPRATATSPHKAHRYGADSRGTHQCQDDATRAFHLGSLRRLRFGCSKI